MEEVYTKILDFSKEKINEENIDRIVDLLTNTKTIGELNVSRNNDAISIFATKFASALKVNKSLTHLNLSQNDIGKDVASALFQHETITHLDLSEVKIPFQFLEEIIMTKNLQDLNVRAVIAYRESKHMTGLKIGISLSHIRLVTSLTILLLTTSSLKYLNVSRSNIDSADAKRLFNALLINESLTDLNLSENNIDGFCISELTEMLKYNKSLKILNLSRNKLNSTDLKAIALALLQNQTLSDINLASNLIQPSVDTRESIALLLRNQTLTGLNLSGNQLGDDILRALAKQLRRNTTLTKLYLDEIMTFLPVVKDFALELQHNSTLSTFRLGITGGIAIDNPFGYVMAKEITTSLNMNTAVRSLDFSFFDLGDEGTLHIAEFLKHNKTVTDLKLCWNYISDKGFEYIAEALVINKTLLSLNLEQHRSFSEGIDALWNALKINRTLVSLNISRIPLNSKAEAGANELVEVLKCNHVLNSLHLGGIQMNRDELKKLAQAFQLNTTILNFQLEHYFERYSFFPKNIYFPPPEEFLFYLERNRNLLRKLTGIARYIYSHRGETEVILSRISRKDLEDFEEYKGRSALLNSLTEFGFCTSQAVKVIDYVHFFIKSNLFNIAGIYEGIFCSLPLEVLFKIACYLMLKDVRQ